MIVLKTVLVADLENSPIRIFASQEEALAHLCDHVLTRPEAHYWSHLIDGYRRIVDPTNDSELDRVALTFWNISGNEESDAQTLYDGYAKEIGLSLYVATAQQWMWEATSRGKTKRFGIGTNSVTVIWTEHVVVSAMLEPYAAPRLQQTVSYHDRKGNARPRKATWLSRKKPPLDDVRPEDNENTRYKLFEKAFNSVRRQFHRASKGGKTNDNLLNLSEMPIPGREQWRSISDAALIQHERSEKKR